LRGKGGDDAKDPANGGGFRRFDRGCAGGLWRLEWQALHREYRHDFEHTSQLQYVDCINHAGHVQRWTCG
jgi:hypothetical protein